MSAWQTEEKGRAPGRKGWWKHLFYHCVIKAERGNRISRQRASTRATAARTPFLPRTAESQETDRHSAPVERVLGLCTHKAPQTVELPACVLPFVSRENGSACTLLRAPCAPVVDSLEGTTMLTFGKYVYGATQIQALAWTAGGYVSRQFCRDGICRLRWREQGVEQYKKEGQIHGQAKHKLS